MTEKQLFQLICDLLSAGFVLAGFNVTDPANAKYVDIRQGEQPTITGRPKGMAVLLTSLHDHRYGWVQRKDEWDADQQKMIHTEAQKMESTFQLSTLAPQNPQSPTFVTDPTAADLAYRASAILQSSATLAALKTAKVGIYRITEIRKPNFMENDRDQFEQSPSFDFTLNYTNTDTTEGPVITKYDLEIDPV